MVELDITKPTSQLIQLAEGGRGGLGNPHFQLPHAPSCRLASKGTQPPTRTFSFELKLLADVGLVGLPNAGKSTILRGLTGRKAEVAGYQFTTLNPQVGVVRVFDDGTWTGQGEVVHESEEERAREVKDRQEGVYMPTPKEQRALRAPSTALATDEKSRIEQSRFTIADNPGLLPLASQNIGLGHSFLRSIERSLALVYVVDLGSDPLADIATLKAELEAYKEGLSDKVCAVVLNKADLVQPEEGKERVEKVREAVGLKVEVVVLSGKYGLGMERLVQKLAGTVAERRAGQSTA